MRKRIDARIDDELEQLTGRTTSAILKLTLEAYYDRVRNTPNRAKPALTNAGFVGCAQGEPDLSVRYKNVRG